MNQENNNSQETQNAQDTPTYQAIKRLAIPESLMPVKDIPELLVENRRICMEMAAGHAADGYARHLFRGAADGSHFRQRPE